MSRLRSVGGNYFWVVTYLGLMLIAGLLGVFYSYSYALGRIALELLWIFFGLLFVLISKWKNIHNGRYAIFGPIDEKRSKLLYKAGYWLIGVSLFLIFVRAFVIIE